MLTYEPAHRISAAEALQHPFLASCDTGDRVSGADLRASLLKLRQFHTQTVMQKAVLAYAASQQLRPKDEARIRALFDEFDTNRDGALSREELVNSFKQLFKDDRRARQEAERTMKNVDLNHNGRIEYNGKSWTVMLRVLGSQLDVIQCPQRAEPQRRL